MAYDALMAAAKSLPEDKIYDVIAFIDFLKARMQPAASYSEQAGGVRRHKKRKLGQMKGKIRMADDFDEIPADFKEYV